MSVYHIDKIFQIVRASDEIVKIKLKIFRKIVIENPIKMSLFK